MSLQVSSVCRCGGEELLFIASPAVMSLEHSRTEEDPEPEELFCTSHPSVSYFTPSVWSFERLNYLIVSRAVSSSRPLSLFKDTTLCCFCIVLFLSENLHHMQQILIMLGLFLCAACLTLQPDQVGELCPNTW